MLTLLENADASAFSRRVSISVMTLILTLPRIRGVKSFPQALILTVRENAEPKNHK